MKQQEQHQWLFDNGGPVIRYRTATELLEHDKSININKLRNEMMQSPEVRKWMDLLRYVHDPKNIKRLRKKLLERPWARRGLETDGEKFIEKHMKSMVGLEIYSAESTCLLSIIGKLNNYGIKKGFPEFDQKLAPYIEWLDGKTDILFKRTVGFEGADVIFTSFIIILAGFINIPVFKKCVKNRLDDLYEFTQKGDYNIYTHPKKYKGKRPITRFDVEHLVPTTWDIIILAEYIKKYAAEKDHEKADTVINYIFNENYQNLHYGFGIGSDGTSSSYSVHIPGYTDVELPNHVSNYLVWLVNILINFRAARKHPWFIERLDHLEKFKTNNGTYLFPKEYLPEKKAGAWIYGVYMGLGEDHKNKQWLELESTFWMCRFKKMMKDCKSE